MSAKHTTCIPDGYSVDESGIVYADTDWRGFGFRALTQDLNSHGYPSVRLVFPDGTRKRVAVHRMVAEAFLSPRPSPEHEIRHLNGDRKDNRARNLKWGTRSENAQDRVQHGRTYRPDWSDPEKRERWSASMRGKKKVSHA
jgi:hypothetical protein